MNLPACITRFDAATYAEAVCRPKRFYDVIISRPPHALFGSRGLIGVWSPVPPMRCLLTVEGLDDRIRDGFRACILREFDELPV